MVWTSEDIELLREGVEYKIPIKILANKLKRSPTALNKAISRFNIRNRKKKMVLKNKKIQRCKKTEKIKNIEKIKRNTENLKRSSWNEVTVFLEKQGYLISEKNVLLGAKKLVKLFFLDNKPISPTRLLVMANSIRLETKKPIFIL